MTASGVDTAGERGSGGPGGLRGRLMGHRYAKMMQGDGLRAKALRGSGWTIAGFGASQILRLGSNLILTRLLFPEAFGLMALASVFIGGLQMLSDIGVGPSIVQNKLGDDPDFLATAWTMQVIRGFALCLGVCLLAYPVSLIYKEPLLFPILIVTGLSTIATGFQSIGLATASRKMALGRLTMLDLVTQVIGIATMVVWAWLHPTVWALVGGGLVSTVLKIGLGHWVLGSPGNRFHFDRSAASEIFRFGKWIFVGTAMTYLGGQGIRLVQGFLVPMDVLGHISIASLLAWSMGQLVQKVGSSVLFPSFSEIARDRPDTLYARLREARTKLFVLTLPVFGSLILFGQPLIDLMYDERYSAAGLYLTILATGGGMAAMRTPFGMVLLSTGDSYGHSLIMTVSAAVRVAATVTGFAVAGVEGMLIASVLSQFLIYPLDAWRLRLAGLWMPWFDIGSFLLYVLLGLLAVFTTTNYGSP